MLGSPEIVSMVANFEQAVFDGLEREDSSHHSNTPAFKTRFASNFKSLQSTIVSKGNPFLEDIEDLYNIFTKRVVAEDVVTTVYTAEERGRRQYEEFCEERLGGKRKIMDPMKTNKVALFSTPPRKIQDKAKAKMAGLKSDRNLFSRLYIACQTRDGDLTEFFSHENQAFPPSLSNEIGEMRACAKSDLVQCLTDISADSISDSIPKVGMMKRFLLHYNDSCVI